jgi:hypothetical protein
MPPILLIQALGLLDPSNDNHWTGDGSPRLDVIKGFAGRAVTREEISGVSKDFSRKNPLLLEQSTSKNSNGAQAGTGKENAGDDVKARVEAECIEAHTQFVVAQKRQVAATAAMDAIITAEANVNAGVTTAEDIKAFQASQLSQRALKAADTRELAVLIANHRSSK